MQHSPSKKRIWFHFQHRSLLPRGKRATAVLFGTRNPQDQRAGFLGPASKWRSICRSRSPGFGANFRRMNKIGIQSVNTGRMSQVSTLERLTGISPSYVSRFLSIACRTMACVSVFRNGPELAHYFLLNRGFCNRLPHLKLSCRV